MNEYVDKVINLAFCSIPLTEDEKVYIARGYNENNKQELIRIAEKKKVLPVVGKLMISLQVDTAFWESKYNFFRERNIKITDLIARIFDSFAENGINNICVFENYGAMLSAGTDIALYSSGDVDLYADVAFKSRICDVLAEYSYFPTQNDFNERNIVTEFLKDDGIIRINVAWKPLRRFLLPFKSDTSKYFVWNDMKYYNDTHIRFPSPETLLYLCFLRIAVHGYSRSPDIRLYIDTFNATRRNPDWNTVVQWAENDAVLTKFITVAVIANDLIKLDVPDFVLKLAKDDKHARKILDIAYDFRKHTLKYDPAGLTLLKLEAASDNRTFIGQIFHMLLPSAKWVKEYYSTDSETYITAYTHYYKHLL